MIIRMMQTETARSYVNNLKGLRGGRRMFCQKCGKELQSGEEFCVSCGAKKVATSVPYEKTARNTKSPQRQSNTVAEASSPKYTGERNKSIILGVIVAIVAIAILVTTIFLIRGKKSEEIAIDKPKSVAKESSGSEDVLTEAKAIKEVFPDIELAKAIVEMGGFEDVDAVVGQEDLDKLIGFSSYNYVTTDVKSLEGIQYCHNLEVIGLTHGEIKDISPLAKLKNLKELNLGSNKIADISALRNLTNIGLLNLSNNEISDLIPLRDMNELYSLDLLGNPINDLSPLKDLKGLKYLTIIGCENADTTTLEGTSIEIIDSPVAEG